MSLYAVEGRVSSVNALVFSIAPVWPYNSQTNIDGVTVDTMTFVEQGTMPRDAKHCIVITANQQFAMKDFSVAHGDCVRIVVDGNVLISALPETIAPISLTIL